MLLIIENIKLALSSIKANKMRSFLTMLGIIIGISSVITIASLGQTSKEVISKEFEAFGKNRVVIYMPYSEQIKDSDYFNIEDIQKINAKYKEDIEYISPSIYSSSEVRSGRNSANVEINGIAQGYENMVGNMDVIKGRFINETDIKSRRDAAVIDEKLAEKFFGSSEAIGKTLRCEVDSNVTDVKIIGVYRTKPSIFDTLGSSDMTTMYMPYSVFSSQLSFIGAIDIKITEDKPAQMTGQNIADFMARSKNREPGFYITQSTQQEQGSIDNVLNTISLAIGAIAAISLLVGGIGIMNIMLVSVTERTREIGIRKSLGARRKDILLQFLTEAMIVSATGGIIGTTLGLLLSSGISIFLKVPPVIDPAMVLISVAFSAIVGMFFGLYPANKAAKLDPIDALRYE